MNEHNWFDFGYQSGSCSVCPLWIHRSGWDCWYRVPLFNDKTSWSSLCVSTPGYGPGQSPVKILISNIIWLLQNRLCSKTARGSVFFCCLLQDFMWFVTNLLHRTWLSPSYRGKHIQGQHFGLSSLMHGLRESWFSVCIWALCSCFREHSLSHCALSVLGF